MFAELARARFLAFFFILGIGLMVASDLSALVETPRDALVGEALHLVGLGLLVTTMLEPFAATLTNRRVASAVTIFCNLYFVWHLVALLWTTTG
jgi:hypothetical protein